MILAYKHFLVDTDTKLRGVLSKFRGEIFQKPPMYSALKQNGTRLDERAGCASRFSSSFCFLASARLYELARKGIEVERELRQVTVYGLDYVERSLPEFGIDVECR